MTDIWQFWRSQLAGGQPETTPGTPHAGYFLNPWRESYPNPSPTVGGPRRKIRIIPGAAAIWKDDGAGWLCRIDSPQSVRLITDDGEIDQLFSRICRKAIDFETYTKLVGEIDEQRCNAGTAPVCAYGNVSPLRDGSCAV